MCIVHPLYKSIHCIVVQIILYTWLYIKGVYNINVLNVHCTAYTIHTAYNYIQCTRIQYTCVISLLLTF